MMELIGRERISFSLYETVSDFRAVATKFHVTFSINSSVRLMRTVIAEL